MPPKQKALRARLSPEGRKATILRTARKLFAETGHEDFLPAEVARRAGISEATIYRYFPTKRDLLVTLAEEWLSEILEEEPDFAQLGDVFTQLRHVVRYCFLVIRREPMLSRFVLTVLRTDPNYRAMEIYRLNRRFTASITSVLDAATNTGLFRKDVSAKLLRDIIFGAVEHQTWAFLRGEGDFPTDSAADAIAELIFRGMIAPTADAKKATAAIEKLKGLTQSIEDQAGALRAAIADVEYSAMRLK